MISFTVNLYLLFSACFVVEGTLTPDDTGPLDCGSQRSFTCSVTGGAAWNITGLSGINVPAIPTGRSIADINGRIDTTDTSGATQSSTITITGFTTADNGGTIQCIDLGDNSVQGMASISVESFSPQMNLMVTRSSCAVNLQWDQPSIPSDITTSVNCTPPSPGCTACTTSPCTITGLEPNISYLFTVIFNSRLCGTTMNTTSATTSTMFGVPFCPLNETSATSIDCNTTNVTWQQPPKTPPVTSTTVTYCPTSSSNCGNSMTCTTIPCTISGLDPGTEYQFTVIPNNNCGSPTGCTGNNASIPPGVPSCHSSVVAVPHDNNDAITVSWQQSPDAPPVASTIVTYCPKSSANCGNSKSCVTNPCTISGLDPGTEYHFTAIPSNNCGSSTGCMGNKASATTTGVSRLVLLVLLVLLLIPLPLYPLGVFIVQRCYYKDKSYCEVFWCCWCCGCCTKGRSGRNSTQPMKSPVSDDDTQDKTGKKEDKVTYAALEFSEQAGSTGKEIHSKNEPVQYADVDHA